MQRILVVDDDPSVTSMLKRGLSYEGFEVETVGNGEDGLSMAREWRPDLMTLDIMMPGISGLEVLARLRAAGNTLPVVLLTAKDASDDEIVGLESGADDYIIKPFTFGVLLAHLHVLLRRHEAEHPPLRRFADLELNTGTRRARRGRRTIDLTPTEYKLLSLLLESPCQVIEREAIIENIWGYDFDGDTNIIETYIKQLRQKLEVEGEERLIHTIRGVGYVLREA